MYTFESRVRFSEVDHTELLTLPALVNYFQDCSTFQSEDIGYGVEVLKKSGQAWILSAWQIVVNRYPKLGERIRVSTWATDFTGLFGLRNFKMEDEAGEMTGWANSVWVYMDMKNTQLYISFTNFTAGKKMQKEGGLFRSTKGEGHGFGLVRIDAIVERLDGYISRNSEDGAFTTEILLPQE